MSWKLIFLLSLFGVGMGFAGVYGLSSKAEAIVWLPLFILSAYLLGRYAKHKFFLNGFATGLASSIWLIIIHLKYSVLYITHHPAEAAQYVKMHNESGATIAQCILLTNAFSGLMSSIVLGLFTRMVSAYLRKLGGER